ncbi:MAG: hypothetical protein V4511_03985 [Bacteroidota bacterium]
MKKIKFILVLGVMPLLLNSCVVMSSHVTTGNPIGTKTGVVKSKLVGDSDSGIAAAAKEGKITKIGSVDIKFLTSGKLVVIVTGE